MPTIALVTFSPHLTLVSMLVLLQKVVPAAQREPPTKPVKHAKRIIKKFGSDRAAKLTRRCNAAADRVFHAVQEAQDASKEWMAASEVITEALDDALSARSKILKSLETLPVLEEAEEGSDETSDEEVEADGSEEDTGKQLEDSSDGGRAGKKVVQLTDDEDD